MAGIVDPRSVERRQYFLLVELDELGLVGADLMDRDHVEAGVDVLRDRLDVGVRVRPTGDRLGDVLPGDALGRVGEVGRRREVPEQRTRERFLWPQFGDGVDGVVLVVGRLLEGPDESVVRNDGDQPVADLAGRAGRVRTVGGDRDLRGLLGTRVEFRVLDGVVLAVVAEGLALPEPPDDVNRPSSIVAAVAVAWAITAG